MPAAGPFRNTRCARPTSYPGHIPFGDIAQVRSGAIRVTVSDGSYCVEDGALPASSGPNERDELPVKVDLRSVLEAAVAGDFGRDEAHLSSARDRPKAIRHVVPYSKPRTGLHLARHPASP